MIHNDTIRPHGSPYAFSYRPVPGPRGTKPLLGAGSVDSGAGGQRPRYRYCDARRGTAQLPQLPSPPDAFAGTSATICQGGPTGAFWGPPAFPMIHNDTIRPSAFMDPLTHSATGLFLGRAGLNRFSEQAPWILVLAANAPDIDIVTLAGGPLNYLNYHRHLTHSLAAWPVMALLPVLAVRLFTRKPFRWLGAYAISLAAVASHLLLDYTNIYGIRFLLPFSGRWFRLDLTSVVDLWIWGVLLVGLAGPLIARLVNAEIGARTKSAGRGFAIFALLFLALYNAGRGVLHARAVATLDSRIYAGAAPQRVAALPGAVNPLAWRGLVETREFYSVVD